LLEGLQRVSKASDSIAEVRGKGLVLGIDVVDSKQNQSPSKEKALKLMELARERQILFGRGGQHGNTLLVTPPLCITLEDAKYAVQAF
jgi:4-aminobutyrate aminotransferase-like enzyme